MFHVTYREHRGRSILVSILTLPPFAAGFAALRWLLCLRSRGSVILLSGLG